MRLSTKTQLFAQCGYVGELLLESLLCLQREKISGKKLMSPRRLKIVTEIQQSAIALSDDEYRLLLIMIFYIYEVGAACEFAASVRYLFISNMGGGENSSLDSQTLLLLMIY